LDALRKAKVPKQGVCVSSRTRITVEVAAMTATATQAYLRYRITILSDNLSTSIPQISSQ
jgi:hypothetical protein